MKYVLTYEDYIKCDNPRIKLYKKKETKVFDALHHLLDIGGTVFGEISKHTSVEYVAIIMQSGYTESLFRNGTYTFYRTYAGVNGLGCQSFRVDLVDYD